MEPVAEPVDVVGAVEPGRRSYRLLRGFAMGVVGLLVLYVAVLVIAPNISKLKVARGGWRLYRCQPMGGSIPSDFSGMVRITPGYSTSLPKAVRDEDKLYVAESVSDGRGHDLGSAVWSAADDYGGPFHPVQAANDVARLVALNPDGTDTNPSPGAVEAAAGCVTKR